MNGPLVAVLMVLAACSVIWWFWWGAVTNASAPALYAMATALAVGFAAALAAAWGRTLGGVIETALGVGVISVAIAVRGLFWDSLSSGPPKPPEPQ